MKAAPVIPPKINDSLEFLRNYLNDPDPKNIPNSEKNIKNALECLANSKCVLSFKPIDKKIKTCNFCPEKILKTNEFLLLCDCFQYCHTKCLKGTVLLISADLNPNKIKLTCNICSNPITFELIEKCFEKGEIEKIRGLYLCRLCDRKIEADSNKVKTKKCECQQIYHHDCLKKQARLLSRGLDEQELKEKLSCLNCKNPISYKIIKECYNEKELKAIQEEELNLKFIEELDKKEKEENKLAAANKTETCSICGEDKVVEKFFITLGCNHRFCKECLQGYVNSKINDSQLTDKDLVCPNGTCKYAISHQILEYILEKDKLEQLDNFVLQHVQSNMIGADEIALRCPKAECIYFFVMDKDANITHHKCEVCGLEFCVKGCREAHKGKTCEEHKAHLAELRRQEEERRLEEIRKIEEEAKRLEEMKKFNEWKEMNDKAEENFNLLVAKEKLRICPKCNVWVQKVSGCNHITCNRCKAQFCYMCGTYEWQKCGHQMMQI